MAGRFFYEWIECYKSVLIFLDFWWILRYLFRSSFTGKMCHCLLLQPRWVHHHLAWMTFIVISHPFHVRLNKNDVKFCEFSICKNNHDPKSSLEIIKLMKIQKNHDSYFFFFLPFCSKNRWHHPFCHNSAQRTLVTFLSPRQQRGAQDANHYPMCQSKLESNTGGSSGWRWVAEARHGDGWHDIWVIYNI